MKDSLDILLNSGRILPVMEEFYSLQGEGFNTGSAAYFIRLGGCDIGCRWCDAKEAWNAGKVPPISTDKVVERASSFPARSIVVTGGEPLLYNLDYLCDCLMQKSMKRFLETSGSLPLTGNWDWICLSPKKEAPPLPGIFNIADELKIIIFDTDDFIWAEVNKEKIKRGTFLYLQPEWSRRNKIIPEIVSYIKVNPEWKISLQSHKYMHIP